MKIEKGKKEEGEEEEKKKGGTDLFLIATSTPNINGFEGGISLGAFLDIRYVWCFASGQAVCFLCFLVKIKKKDDCEK